MTERDRAAVDADLRPVEAELATVGEGLGGERLVDLGPMSTSSIGVPAGTPDRSTAARMATPPSSTAGTVLNAPPNFPIGVRAAETR